MKLLQKNFFWLLLIMLATVFSYLRTFQNGFAVDDYPAFYNNDLVNQGLSSTGEIFSRSFYYGYDQREEANEYRPITSLLFATQVELFGLTRAGLWHGLSLLLYLVLVWLTFRWIRQLSDDRTALIATALFALIPVHSEVVLNIKAQDDLLAGVFLLGAWLWWWPERSRQKTILATLLFTFALFAKELAVPLILVFPAIDYLKLKRIPIDNLVLLLPLGGYFLARSLAIEPPDQVDVVNNALAFTDNYAEQSAMGFELLLRYLGKLLLPLELSWDYSFRHFELHGWSSWMSLCGAALFLGALWVLYRSIPKPQLWGFSVFLFLVSIGLYLHLVMLLEATFAERFLLIPSIAFAVWLALLLRQKKAGLVITGILCLLYAAQNHERSQDWKDNLSLFQADIEKVPNSIRANSALAFSLYEQAIQTDPPDAVLLEKSSGYFTTAINIYGNDADTWYNYGMCNLALGEYTMAELSFLESVRLKPSHSMAYNNLGNISYLKGEHSRAKEYYLKSVQSNAKNADAWSNLGAEYLLSRQNDSAWHALQRAVTLDPENEQAQYNMEVAKKRLGY